MISCTGGGRRPQPAALQGTRAAAGTATGTATGFRSRGRDRDRGRIRGRLNLRASTRHHRRRDAGATSIAAPFVAPASRGRWNQPASAHQENASHWGAGFDIVPERPTGFAALPAQCQTGLPRRAHRGQFSRQRGRPPARGRRGRSPPRFPRATWDAMGVPEGRSRRNQGQRQRPVPGQRPRPGQRQRTEQPQDQRSPGPSGASLPARHEAAGARAARSQSSPSSPIDRAARATLGRLGRLRRPELKDGRTASASVTVASDADADADASRMAVEKQP